MDIATFCRESRIIVVTGKGGVGKTTISAALALTGAGAGLSVLLVELEGRTGMSAAFGQPETLEYEEQLLRPPTGPGTAGGSIRARRLTPDDALLEYLDDHGLHRVSKRLVRSGIVDVVSTAIPGIRDVLVLGKIKQLERDRVADLIIVDTPATGHAVTFLTSARGLLDAARGGPVRTQAMEVAEMLKDPARFRALLVTLPEEMPVSETIESAYKIEDRAGVHLGPVVVNGFDEAATVLDESAVEAAEAAGVSLTTPDLAVLEAARVFRRERFELQRQQLDRLGQELPLPRFVLPLLFTDSIGPQESARLAEALSVGIGQLEPEPVA